MRADGLKIKIVISNGPWFLRTPGEDHKTMTDRTGDVADVQPRNEVNRPGHL